MFFFQPMVAFSPAAVLVAAVVGVVFVPLLLLGTEKQHRVTKGQDQLLPTVTWGMGAGCREVAPV
jgi:Flp pilus assembly protein TadB